MMADGSSTDAPTAGAIPSETAAMVEASTLHTRLWPAFLVLASVGGSLALTCVAPFAAFAVATASTLRLCSALGTMAVIWLTNQAVGFGALDYPWTLNTALWGLAIGAAAGLATLVAAEVLGRFHVSPRWFRLALAFGAAFMGYEVVLMAVALVLGSGDVFTAAIIGRLALIDAAWLGGLLLVYAILAACAQRQHEVPPRLAQVS